jgi:hypothetical protein
MADVVRQDEEEFGDVEGFARAKKDVREHGIHQRMGVAAGAVEQEDGIIDVALGIAMRSAQGEVVETKPGERFAVLKLEVLDGVDAVFGRPLGGRGRVLLGRGGDGESEECGREQGAAEIHSASEVA